MYKILFGSPVRFIEFIMVATMLITFASQIIWPLLTYRPMFPIFSKKPKLAKEIASVKEEMDEEEMKAEIARLKAELKRKKVVDDLFSTTKESPAPKERGSKQTNNKNNKK